MSTIDLERLIVRQTYLVPLKASDLRIAVLTELRKKSKGVPTYLAPGIYEWNLVEQRENCFAYSYNFAVPYILERTASEFGKRGYSELARKKDEEFTAGGVKTLDQAMMRLLDNKPVDLYVLITDKQKGRCKVKVECSSNLYLKLSRKKIAPEKINEFKIQDAYLTCRRFVQHIFEGGLSATFVSEEKKELMELTAQLLFNDQASRQILARMEKMLDEATGEVLLCGWIGTLLLPKLEEINQKGVKIRVVTHKAKELKGKQGYQDVQRAFKGLISMIGKDNISIRPECHCRVVVVDNKALIGSMDINAISLTGSHREIAIYTEDPEIVRNLRKYFNEIFSPLKKIKS